MPARKRTRVGDENHLTVGYQIHIRDVREHQYELKELIEFRGYNDITLDFTDTVIFFAEAALPLVAFCRRYHEEENVRFNVVLPRNEKLRRLFLNANWAHYIDPETYPKNSTDLATNLPTKEFRGPKDQNDVVNKVLDTILRITTFLERDHLRALEWSLQEITDNVLQHSESATGGFVQLSVHPNAKEIEFIVADAGIGVPDSLKPVLPANATDAQALQEAVREGVTRGTGQGNGLFGSFQICAISGGPFYLNAGDAFLTLDRYGRSQAKIEDRRLRGTTVVCTLNYSRPLILERSLKIAGRSFQTTDVVEVVYEQYDSNFLQFSLITEAESVGSRMAGYGVKTKLENLLRMSGAVGVVIDAAGIGIMSSSFADEAFAKLRLKLGEEQYRSTVKFINLQPINEQIIQRSINQRLQKH